MGEVIDFDPTVIKVKAYVYDGYEKVINKFNIITNGVTCYLPKDEGLYEIEIGDTILQDQFTKKVYLQKPWAMKKTPPSANTFLISTACLV